MVVDFVVTRRSDLDAALCGRAAFLYPKPSYQLTSLRTLLFVSLLLLMAGYSSAVHTGSLLSIVLYIPMLESTRTDLSVAYSSTMIALPLLNLSPPVDYAYGGRDTKSVFNLPGIQWYTYTIESRRNCDVDSVGKSECEVSKNLQILILTWKLAFYHILPGYSEHQITHR